MYSGLPTELDQLIAALDETTPLNQLFSTEREIRLWLKSFSERYFDASGRFKAEAARAVLRGQLTAEDLAEGSIDAAKLAPGTITGDRIADGAVTGQHVAAATLTGEHIAKGSLTADLLAVGTVSGSHIAPGTLSTEHIVANSLSGSVLVPASVTGDKIATNAIQGYHLPTGASGQVLLGGNTVGGVANSFAPRTLSGDIEVDSDGVVRLTSGFGARFVRIVEEAPSGVAMNVPFDANETANWFERGLTIPWKVDVDEGRLVRLRDSVILLTEPGNYFIMASAPVHAAAGSNNVVHRLAVVVSYGSQYQRWFGTTDRFTGTQASISTVLAMIRLEGITEATPAALNVLHYIRRSSTSLAVQFGTYAQLAGIPETYAIVQIIKYQ